MAEKTKEKVQETEGGVVDTIRTGNQITDKAIEDALSDINKEKDDKKKREAKKQLCIATYVNRKTLLQHKKNDREKEIGKEKLNKSKELLERLLGVECDIKDGECVPNMKKKIPADRRLTPTEHEAETKKMEEEFAKKISESDKKYNNDMRELRNSYEGEYRHYVECYWY